MKLDLPQRINQDKYSQQTEAEEGEANAIPYPTDVNETPKAIDSPKSSTAIVLFEEMS